jgi:hypothetical protein
VPRSTTRVAATLAVGLGRLHKSDGCVIGRGVGPPGDILHWVDPSSARRNELLVALAVRALQTPSHALGVLQDGHSECPLGGAGKPQFLRVEVGLRPLFTDRLVQQVADQPELVLGVLNSSSLWSFQSFPGGAFLAKPGDWLS